MKAEERRERIMAALRAEDKAVSATALAGLLRVSRQVIVGDVALLRARGSDIVATSRGYMLSASMPSGCYTGKIACRHSAADTEKELLAIIDLGGRIVDVTVTHRLYGDLTGQLNLTTREDVRDFINNIKSGKGRLLLELTDGVHLHTVTCRDRVTFEAISEELDRLGVLFAE